MKEKTYWNKGNSALSVQKKITKAFEELSKPKLKHDSQDDQIWIQS